MLSLLSLAHLLYFFYAVRSFIFLLQKLVHCLPKLPRLPRLHECALAFPVPSHLGTFKTLSKSISTFVLVWDCLFYSTRCFVKLLCLAFSYSISLAHLQLWNRNWRLPEASSLWTSSANCISLIYSVWDHLLKKKVTSSQKNFAVTSICHVLCHSFSKKTDSLISSLFS